MHHEERVQHLATQLTWQVIQKIKYEGLKCMHTLHLKLFIAAHFVSKGMVGRLTDKAQFRQRCV
jgi:hypothetical protein